MRLQGRLPLTPMPPAGGKFARPRAVKNNTAKRKNTMKKGVTNQTEKDCFLSVRLTKEEKQHLEQLAKQSGLTLSNTIRACINGTEIRQSQPAEIGKLYTEVNRIGNNINQIARSVNAGIATAEDARQVLFLLRKVYDLMEAVADL